MLEISIEISQKLVSNFQPIFKCVKCHEYFDENMKLKNIAI